MNEQKKTNDNISKIPQRRKLLIADASEAASFISQVAVANNQPERVRLEQQIVKRRKIFQQ